LKVSRQKNVYYTKFDTTYTVTPLLLCKWPIPVPITTNEEIYVRTINQFVDLILNKTGLLRDKKIKYDYPTKPSGTAGSFFIVIS
jgi:hypothetical protein